MTKGERIKLLERRSKNLEKRLRRLEAAWRMEHPEPDSYDWWNRKISRELAGVATRPAEL